MTIAVANSLLAAFKTKEVSKLNGIYLECTIEIAYILLPVIASKVFWQKFVMFGV